MEYNVVDITSALLAGLPTDKRDRALSNHLDDCYNWTPRAIGLTLPEWASDIVPTGKVGTVSGAYPYLMRGTAETVAIYDNTVATLTRGVSVYTEAAVTLRNPAQYLESGWSPNPPSNYPLTSSLVGAVHFADLENGWFATDGGTIIFKLPDVGVFWAQTGVPQSVCEYRGRLYSAGFHGSQGAFSAAYSNAMEAIHEDYFPDVDFSGYQENTVIWSSVGYDEAYWPWFPWMVTEDKLNSLLKRAEFGAATMPWDGRIMCIKPLGDGIMVYGKLGISFLRPVRSPKTVQRIDIASFGVIGRGAVGGSAEQHIFVDDSGNMWKVTPGPKLEKLGYASTLSALTLSGPSSIQLDEAEGDFHITPYVGAGHLLTPSGLCTTQRKMAGILRDTGLRAYYTNTADNYAQLETGEIVFDTANVKTVCGGELECNLPSAFTVKLYYRVGVADSWLDSGWLSVGKDGKWDFCVSAKQFKLAVKATFSSTSDIRDINKLKLWVRQGGKLSLKELI